VRRGEQAVWILAPDTRRAAVEESEPAPGVETCHAAGRRPLDENHDRVVERVNMEAAWTRSHAVHLSELVSGAMPLVRRRVLRPCGCCCRSSDGLSWERGCDVPRPADGWPSGKAERSEPGLSLAADYGRPSARVPREQPAFRRNRGSRAGARRSASSVQEAAPTMGSGVSTSGYSSR
jgi:hypothetical protein